MKNALYCLLGLAFFEESSVCIDGRFENDKYDRNNVRVVGITHNEDCKSQELLKAFYDAYRAVNLYQQDTLDKNNRIGAEVRVKNVVEILVNNDEKIQNLVRHNINRDHYSIGETNFTFKHIDEELHAINMFVSFMGNLKGSLTKQTLEALLDSLNDCRTAYDFQLCLTDKIADKFLCDACNVLQYACDHKLHGILKEALRCALESYSERTLKSNDVVTNIKDHLKALYLRYYSNNDEIDKLVVDTKVLIRRLMNQNFEMRCDRDRDNIQALRIRANITPEMLLYDVYDRKGDIDKLEFTIKNEGGVVYIAHFFKATH